MKRASHKRDELRREYDFSAGVRGKYAARVDRDAKVVVLAPDVARIYRTAREVNAALRREIRRSPAGKKRP